MNRNLKGNSSQICSLNTCQQGKINFVIAMYISDHGFGHASRNIPIIRYIIERYKNIKIIIKTGKNQGEFIKKLIGEFEGRVSYYFDSMDIGLVLKEGSFEIEVKSLEKKVKNYIEDFREKIKRESKFLQYNNVKLIVSDIVPWIFKCSKKLNISSILITNFTWIEIYKEYLSKEIVSEYIECYRLADKALFYELYIEDMKSYVKNYEEISLCSRDFNFEKVDKIKDGFKKKLVYISVGRSVELKDKIDVSNLDYTFVVTDGIKLKGHNVYYLGKETSNTQDYLMASDFVITKAGWGTISEALLGKKKIAVLSRKSVAEDRNTIKKLKDKGLAIEVNYNKNFNIKEILNELEKFKPEYDKHNLKNDFEVIGDKIINFIECKDGGNKDEKE